MLPFFHRQNKTYQKKHKSNVYILRLANIKFNAFDRTNPFNIEKYVCVYNRHQIIPLYGCFQCTYHLKSLSVLLSSFMPIYLYVYNVS